MNSNTQSFLQKYEDKLTWGMLIFAGVALFVVLGIYAWQFQQQTLSDSPDKWGVFGDFIGGTLNPIFAFLAFLILAMSFRLQSKELKETREELAKASDAQVLQAELAKKQIEQVDRQNFEALFFNLLNLKKECLDICMYQDLNGQEAFKKYIQSYIFYLLHEDDNSLDMSKPSFFIFEIYANKFLNIINIVNDTKLDFKSKKQYVVMLLSTMSIAEKIIVFNFVINKWNYLKDNFANIDLINHKEKFITHGKKIHTLKQQIRLLKLYEVFSDVSVFSDMFSDRLYWQLEDQEELNVFEFDIYKKNKLFNTL